MERESLHGVDQPLSLYKSHIRSPMVMEPYLPKPYYTTFPLSNGLGLLKAPPLSLPSLSLQPPLLPLPASLPRRSSSCPAPAIKIAQKKSKNSSKPKNKNNTNNPRKEERETPKRSSIVTVSSTSKFGSDTKKLPKNIARVTYFDDSIEDGSVVFGISPPPPSSLPLPTFSLRPKLGCNAAVAAGIDAGATDDLRRLLRLQ